MHKSEAKDVCFFRCAVWHSQCITFKALDLESPALGGKKLEEEERKGNLGIYNTISKNMDCMVPFMA
jgi:hypothetical protein